MIRLLRLRLPRLAAAALAVFGLMASSARSVLACTMPGAGSVAISPAAVNAPVAADPHAHHHASAASVGADAAPADAPAAGESAPPAPAHEPCPDLVHCAVLAWTPPPPALPSAVAAPKMRVVGLDTRLMSVGRPIDTPPPKRG